LVNGFAEENNSPDGFEEDLGGNGSVMISNDRSVTTVRLIGNDCYLSYKRALQERDFLNACDQAEFLPATVTSDGYSCTLRGRVTLKEIVFGDDVPGLRPIRAIVSCLTELIKCAKEYGVDAREFVYDYSAVIVRNIDSDYKFLYMPGLKKVAERTTVNDLVKILFLNTDTDSIPASDYERLRDDVRRIRPEENPDEVIEDLERLIERIDSLTTDVTLKDKLFGFFRQKNARSPEQEKEQLFSCSIRGVGDIEPLQMERQIAKERRIYLRIGRDGDWADILVPSLFASRRHATLVISGDGRIELENFSMNGLAVDGEEVKDVYERDIRGQEVTVKITENCGIVLSAA